MKEPRFLITTADERTWKFDEQVLFLGEWCRLYQRKKVWSEMNASVAAPYGLEQDIKERDRLYLQRLSARLLEVLVEAMNLHHGTNHSIRYWNIVLGHWLQRFVSVAINRYNCLEKAMSENNVVDTYVFNEKEYILATPTSIDFQWALYDDVWNHHFYAKIMAFWGGVNRTPVDFGSSARSTPLEEERNGRRSRKEQLRDLWNLVSENLASASDAFIVNSYLPTIEAIKLQLSLRQFPAFWITPRLRTTAFDSRQREKLQIDDFGNSEFERFLRETLKGAIPTCYLEGYQQLLEQAMGLPWPKKPKFIFTSNNFDTDELFKVWTAEKVERGHKYYVGQHGNLYGTWIYHSEDIPELATPDKFITWGWEARDTKIVPAFIFTTVNKKRRKRAGSGGLLLVERCIYNRLATYDRHINHHIYQNEQFRFVGALTNTIRKELTVRLSAHKLGRRTWSDDQRWRDFDAEINIDLGASNLWNLINRSRIVVHSYDSTGILETLSLNIPTIGFWHDLYGEMTLDAKKYYKMLENANILFPTPELAAKHIERYWKNIDSWWSSKVTQSARHDFCSQYAKTVKHPIAMLRSLLCSNNLLRARVN